MNKLQKAFGIGALLLVVSGCKDNFPKHKIGTTIHNAPVPEIVTDKNENRPGSYENSAKGILDNVIMYGSLVDTSKDEMTSSILEEANKLSRHYPAAVVREYFRLAKEKNYELPADKIKKIQGIACDNEISYELSLAKSRIVDNDFPESAMAHLTIAYDVAKECEIDISRSKYNKIISELDSLLKEHGYDPTKARAGFDSPIEQSK